MLFGGKWWLLNTAAAGGIGVSKEVKDYYGVSLWKSIHRGWPSFSKHLLFMVGDGTRVQF